MNIYKYTAENEHYKIFMPWDGVDPDFVFMTFPQGLYDRITVKMNDYFYGVSTDITELSMSYIYSIVQKAYSSLYQTANYQEPEKYWLELFPDKKEIIIFPLQ